MLKAILIGGLVAAVLDILYAFIVYGPAFPMLAPGADPLSPMQVLQSVARGWVGRDAAREGGINTALLGALTHVGLAMIMAAVFVFAAKALPMLTRQAVLWGLVYGIILWFVMNYVVVPVSAANTSQHFAGSIGEAMTRIQEAVGAMFPIKRPLLFAGTVFTHTVFVGLPIALAAKKFADGGEGG